MNSETGQRSASNSNLSSVSSDQAMNFQAAGYAGYFFWPPYFHQLNLESNRLSMVNSSNQVGPQSCLNLTERDLNLSSLIQGFNYSPLLASSSFSNMKDLCRYNPSNSSKNGKNPQTDNNSLKFRPNCDDWNSKDDIDKYIADGAPSNQYAISENSDSDCPQNLVVGEKNEREERNKREMTTVERKIAGDLAVIKQIRKRAAYQGYPIYQPQSTHPTWKCAVVAENKMEEIITKELDLALLLSQKSRMNSRSLRLNQQAKQKTRPKIRKNSIIKNRLISNTVERIKAAELNCSQNPASLQMNKISDHEANQQSTQNRSFPQPEALNQYQDNTPKQFQHPQLTCQPKPEVRRQPADSQFVGRKPKRYRTSKKSDARMKDTIPSSSTSVFKPPSVLVGNYNSTNHSILKILHK